MAYRGAPTDHCHQFLCHSTNARNNADSIFELARCGARADDHLEKACEDTTGITTPRLIGVEWSSKPHPYRKFDSICRRVDYAVRESSKTQASFPIYYIKYHFIPVKKGASMAEVALDSSVIVKLTSEQIDDFVKMVQAACRQGE